MKTLQQIFDSYKLHPFYGKDFKKLKPIQIEFMLKYLIRKIDNIILILVILFMVFCVSEAGNYFYCWDQNLKKAKQYQECVPPFLDSMNKYLKKEINITKLSKTSFKLNHLVSKRI